MLNEIARVFSSNGVPIPGSEAVPVRDRRGSAKMPGAAGGATGAAGFDQDADISPIRVRAPNRGASRCDRRRGGRTTEMLPSWPESPQALRRGF